MKDNQTQTQEQEIRKSAAASNKKKNRAKKKKIGRIILLSVLGVVAVALAAVAIWVIPAVTNPASMFETISAEDFNNVTATPIVTEAPKTVEAVPETLIAESEATPAPTPEPTPEPTLQEQGQFDNIINIALLGIDPKNKGYAKDGGDSHTDGIVVVSVNFDQNKVDMISFPRDTFAKVPGHQGFYKINCAVDVGGEGTEEGYLTTCATLSQFLGGLPINYYIAIDHNIVITLGDEIGGVDFDLPFSYEGKIGKYKKGFQHLDGAGIYDYMRCRKECPYPYNTDVSRTKRCREMLLTIFEKLKKEGLLTKIPDIMNTVSDGIYTNLTARQIVALGTYAMNFSTNDVGSYNFDGSLEMNHGWVFYFVDQDSRKEILKTVYGIDAAPIGWCSATYANWLHLTGFQAIKYASQAKKTMALVEDTSALDDRTKKLYDECADALKVLEDTFAETSAIVEAHYDNKYSSSEKTAKHEADTKLVKKEGLSRDATKALYKALGSPSDIKLRWEVDHWYLDSDICETLVDMR